MHCEFDMFRRLSLLSFAGLALLVSCGKNSPEAIPPPAQSAIALTNQRTFQVKGTIIELKPEEKAVTIKHEAIPGYMEAMTMPFEVKDTNELAGLEAGDAVSFRMNVTDKEGWIDRLQKLAKPRTTNLPKTGPFRLVREVEPLSVGDVLPEYHFTNQLGQAVSLSLFRGQALAITFVFTRCPYPNFCPLMSSNFEDAQRKLLALTNAPANWHLLTISFDPEWDTPERLSAYAGRFRPDPKHWSFLTGELIDITAIAEQFGLSFWHEGGGISHNLRTAVVDASGRVRKIFTGNKWMGDELVAEMVKAAAVK
jgi:protein SCO1